MRYFPFILLAGFAACVPAFGQLSDVTPPVLVGLTIAPLSINVTNGPATVSLDAAITDDLSGVGSIHVELVAPGGQRVDSFGGWNPTSGNPLNGHFLLTLVVPQFAQPGVWQIRTAWFSDRVNNQVAYTHDRLVQLGFPASVTVVDANADTVPPRLTAIVMPDVIDVSSAPAVDIPIVLHTIDDKSRLSMPDVGQFGWAIAFRSPSGRQHLYIAGFEDATTVCGDVPDVGRCDWTVKHTFPRHLEAGDWIIENLIITDKSLNKNQYSTAQLQAAGLKSGFQVLDTSPDMTPPELTALSFNRAFVDTSVGPQEVIATFGIKDDLAGATFAPDSPVASYLQGLRIQSPSGNQAYNVGMWSQATLVGGTPNNGSWRANFTLPQFSEAGDWMTESLCLVDLARNQRCYNRTQLSSMGMNPVLVVAKPGSEPDGTLGSGGGYVEDRIFGKRASITVPDNILRGSTEVALDVQSTPPSVPPPLGFQIGTYFMNVHFVPEPPMPFPWPGVTVVVPLPSLATPGDSLVLGRIDPIAGLVVARDPKGLPISGRVDPGGMSATFEHVSRFSMVVGMRMTGVLGDVDGNGVVDCKDLAIVKAAFGKKAGEPGYDPRADINRNGAIDAVDLATVSRQIQNPDACTVTIQGGN